MAGYPQPPAGGFGGAPQNPGQYGPSGPAPKRSTGALIAIIALTVVGVFVVIFGIFAVLGVYGTRKYIQNAKSAEAKNSVMQISKDAVMAFENEDPVAVRADPAGSPSTATGKVCPSAASPVPSSISMVAGKKYQSSSRDWIGDPGWKCLKFEMTMPQYYQYNYTSTSTSFKAIAKGDLDADGETSTFEAQGQIVGGKLVTAPQIMETNPDE